MVKLQAGDPDCLALWMSYCGRSLCDKIVAMILPITLFVASGFEHCIANLFVIPFAIAIRHFAPPPLLATGAQ